jgi:hypothetical protein
LFDVLLHDRAQIEQLRLPFVPANLAPYSADTQAETDRYSSGYGLFSACKVDRLVLLTDSEQSLCPLLAHLLTKPDIRFIWNDWTNLTLQSPCLSAVICLSQTISVMPTSTWLLFMTNDLDIDRTTHRVLEWNWYCQSLGMLGTTFVRHFIKPELL